MHSLVYSSTGARAREQAERTAGPGQRGAATPPARAQWGRPGERGWRPDSRQGGAGASAPRPQHPARARRSERKRWHTALGPHVLTAVSSVNTRKLRHKVGTPFSQSHTVKPRFRRAPTAPSWVYSIKLHLREAPK